MQRPIPGLEERPEKEKDRKELLIDCWHGCMLLSATQHCVEESGGSEKCVVFPHVHSCFPCTANPFTYSVKANLRRRIMLLGKLSDNFFICFCLGGQHFSGYPKNEDYGRVWSWKRHCYRSVVDPNLLNLDPDPELVIQSILKEKIQNNLRKIIFHETSTVYFF